MEGLSLLNNHKHHHFYMQVQAQGVLECPCWTGVRMRWVSTYVWKTPCILHTEITLLPYEKETQLLPRLGTTTKMTKPRNQRGASPWEFVMPQGVRLETGWAEGSAGDSHTFPWAALVAPRSPADTQCPGMLQIFSKTECSHTSGLLRIPDFDTKHQIWCLGPLKTTEVGLLISVGPGIYVGFFPFCRRYLLYWFIK